MTAQNVSHKEFILASSILIGYSVLMVVRLTDILNTDQFVATSGDIGLCGFLIEQSEDPLFRN